MIAQFVRPQFAEHVDQFAGLAQVFGLGRQRTDGFTADGKLKADIPVKAICSYL
jgi:hypothetical protein